MTCIIEKYRGNREWGLINIFNFNGELIEGGGGGGLSRDNTAFIFSLQFWLIVYYSINHPVTSPCTSFSFSLVNNTLIQAFLSEDPQVRPI